MSITVSQSIPLPFPLWYPYVCFLCLCLHFCFVHEFIYTISSRFHICVFLFLTSCYMIVSRSSHISANGTISYLFMAEQYSIIYVPHLCQSKGEKERYKHLNAEFQRIARRNKKAFLSDQCKEIEENNRMGKTRDLFKKIRDTKGTFHAKMGSIKERNGMDLTEADNIKKRWQEYREELYKKTSSQPR